MLKKGSKLYSILTGTCPKCQNERMYVTKNPFLLGSVLKMNENCNHCHLKYQIEPSFFYGAMYVSYAFVVGEMLNVGLLTYLITGNDTSPWLYISTILGAILLLTPINYRYSRIFLLHFLTPKIKYYPDYDTDDKLSNI